jgi:putative salt-induced outer membrane protein YdiY
LTDRLSVFGRFGYLQDEFKGIDYLISPTAGVGYKVVNLERTKFMVDTGARRGRGRRTRCSERSTPAARSPPARTSGIN